MMVGPNIATQPNPDKHKPNPTHQVHDCSNPTQPITMTIYHNIYLQKWSIIQHNESVSQCQNLGNQECIYSQAQQQILVIPKQPVPLV